MTYGRALGGILYVVAAYLMLFQFPYLNTSLLTTVAQITATVLLIWAALLAGINWLRGREHIADEQTR